MKPLVTLITPVFNAMPYFEDYLRSVIVQTWRPIEFIVVDDGSTDGSWEHLMERLPDLEQAGIKVWSIQIPHAGQAAAFNAALPKVSGECITWCDADDKLMPENIEKKVDFLIKHPELGMVRNDGIVIDSVTGQELYSSTKPEDRFTQNIFDRLFHGTTYCYAGCYMIRTELLFACYPDRQIYASPEGQNLQLLLPPASRSDCGFVPEVLHMYCRHGDSHSSKKRSFRQVLDRLENFSKLRQSILSHCLCDVEHYMEEDRKIKDEQKRTLFAQVGNMARGDR